MSERIAVIGAGKTGLSCVEFLLSSHEVIIWLDTRSDAQIDQSRFDPSRVFFYAGLVHFEKLLEMDIVVVSPGIDIRNLTLQRYLSATARIINDITLFNEARKAPLVAITGSNGKSTVTELAAQLIASCSLRVAVGGNLGQPALELLQDKAEYYVLELSSFQLQYSGSFNAQVASVLNLSPDHLDRHKTLEAYRDAKLNILKGAETVVVNRAQAFSRPGLKGTTISFGLDAPEAGHFGLVDHLGEFWLAQGQTRLMPVSALKLQGAHNWANALAALSLTEALGLPMAPRLEALKNYPGLPHRCESLGRVHGVLYINDSKGTNPGATLAALEGLSGVVTAWVLILGGVGKGADFSVLIPVILRVCKVVLLIGETASQLQTLLKSHVSCLQCEDLPQAVEQAARLAVPGEGVLLSPACASFDMFENYEDRGRVFAQAVAALR